jgi:hypothetical protein
VILIWIKNSIEAMPKGGVPTIKEEIATGVLLNLYRYRCWNGYRTRLSTQPFDQRILKLGQRIRNERRIRNYKKATEEILLLTSKIK